MIKEGRDVVFSTAVNHRGQKRKKSLVVGFYMYVD